MTYKVACLGSDGLVTMTDLWQADLTDTDTFISLEEALAFLNLYHAQVVTYLQELRDIEKQVPCCSKQIPFYQQVKLRETEKDANRIFEKLRHKLYTFMSQGPGIKFTEND